MAHREARRAAHFSYGPVAAHQRRAYHYKVVSRFGVTRAAEYWTSLSGQWRMELATVIRQSEKRVSRRAYREAMRRFLSHKPFSFHFIGGRRPTREELHDRGAQKPINP